MASPSIVCLGVIGKNNNPLHIAVFPSYDPESNAPTTIRTPLQFSLLLSSSLDIFEARARANATSGGGLSGDYGLLHAVDERLAVYGFETNTGVKFVAVVDMRGKKAVDAGGRPAIGAIGLKEGDLKPVFKAMQSAYIQLLQNPFYNPDEHAPPTGRGGKKINSRRFAQEMSRIGETWTPGLASL